MPASTADPSRPAVRLRMRRNAVLGFTLIELMIAVAIVALLAAVAMPSYQSYIRKGNRADAISLLQAANLAQEKHRLGSATYTDDETKLKPPCQASPCISQSKHYKLVVSEAEEDGATWAAGYRLNAEAITAMQIGDTDCATIWLEVFGGKSTYGPEGKKCWNK